MFRSFEESLLRPSERVLSTLEADGSRRWMFPRLSKGRFWQARRVFAYVLIAIFTLVPYIHINGRPIVLLDVAERQFHLFGKTFLPTDTLLMALFMLSCFLSIFAFTAIFGRVFCGWACPQTVWLEFVYRPIERLFTGRSGCGGKPTKHVAIWRRGLMYVAFFAISVHLANTSLAYFVGSAKLNDWIWHSTPWQHPGGFLLVTLVTVWMMWDFCYWREQMCIIGCPYGRFQSALLDRHSIIVSYDKQRGEPRGKKKSGERQVESGELQRSTLALPQLSTLHSPLPASSGDCIDCTMCVQVCPTGIDIRNGLQAECVNCTQCIDACDSVMDKIGKPRGLIGYSSQAVRDGQPKKIARPRVIIYPTLLTIVGTLFLFLLFTKPTFDFVILRPVGEAWQPVNNSTAASNRVQLHLTNRGNGPQTFTYEVLGDTGARVESDDTDHVTLTPIQAVDHNVRIVVPSDAFKKGLRGQLPVTIRVHCSDGSYLDRRLTVRGPYRL
ncbi:MAG: cytochrome c oxidase accessory protein CcoG [Tepidisphaeraceae bacterium]